MGIRQALSRLKWFDLSLVAVGIFVVIYVQVVKEGGAGPDVRVDLYGPDFEMTVLRDLGTEDEEAVAEFADWRKNPEYFGAFAAAPDGGFGWSTRYHSQASAKTAALEYCAKWSENCALISFSLPKGYVETGAINMSYVTEGYYRRYLDAKAAKAIAWSEGGFLRFVSARRSREEAEVEALQNCTQAVQEYRADKPLPYWQCQIIGSEELRLLSPEADAQ